MKVGGLPIGIEFDEDRCRDHDEATKLGYMSNNMNLNYWSRLIASTYVRGHSHLVAVLDAMTPFQLASKMWAANAVNMMIRFHGQPNEIIYVGSWFGQQHAIANFYMDDGVKAVLLDKDPEAMRVAKLCYDDSGIENYKTMVMDISEFNWEKMDPEALVVWTGCEHFQPNEIERAINEADSDTRWILQGTDMPAVDHLNLIADPSDLAKYFNTEPIYLGTMTTPVGKRFQVAF